MQLGYNDTVIYSSMNVNVFTAAARSGRGLAASPRHSSSRLDGRDTVSSGASAGDVLNAQCASLAAGRGLPAARCCGEECVVVLQRAEEDPQRRVSVSNHFCEGIGHVFDLFTTRITAKQS